MQANTNENNNSVWRKRQKRRTSAWQTNKAKLYNSLWAVTTVLVIPEKHCS